ncbi:hypothetical protein HMPREF1550_01678, partial [Actinomyces sp. oral taxon 877 str. F0543]
PPGRRSRGRRPPGRRSRGRCPPLRLCAAGPHSSRSHAPAPRPRPPRSAARPRRRSRSPFLPAFLMSVRWPRAPNHPDEAGAAEVREVMSAEGGHDFCHDFDGVLRTRGAPGPRSPIIGA